MMQRAHTRNAYTSGLVTGFVTGFSSGYAEYRNKGRVCQVSTYELVHILSGQDFRNVENGMLPFSLVIWLRCPEMSM